MSYPILTHQVEQILHHAVRETYPRSWDENHISFTWLRRLTSRLQGVQSVDADRPISVRFDAFKLRGQTEYGRGDIAVIVHRQSWEHEVQVGVGYMEAKRRYQGSGLYDQLDFGQLSRIRGNQPHAQVLLYDFDGVLGFTDNLDSWGERNWPYGPLQATHAAVVPAGLVEALGTRSRAMHKYSVPLAHQICGRFLCGFDLDYDPSRRAAIEHAAGELDGISYVLAIGVAPTGENPALPNINRDFYQPLDEVEEDDDLPF